MANQGTERQARQMLLSFQSCFATGFSMTVFAIIAVSDIREVKTGVLPEPKDEPIKSDLASFLRIGRKFFNR